MGRGYAEWQNMLVNMSIQLLVEMFLYINVCIKLFSTSTEWLTLLLLLIKKDEYVFILLFFMLFDADIKGGTVHACVALTQMGFDTADSWHGHTERSRLKPLWSSLDKRHIYPERRCHERDGERLLHRIVIRGAVSLWWNLIPKIFSLFLSDEIIYCLRSGCKDTFN